ncbi:hypothetical protein K493DRAFT_267364 [Basidiobolus meristosporus CBS 931.73]|uniref:Cyclin N-terminal domain-containing protein n=1 Tax=Basidiobolus meristosporus CBS 931.73 TaxID=1314790 RepID=A0A1Y1XU46_9FUNG|nr:hypothetical protein K493DRAFT_267364 [Basidiobolus meristosporus CBS 931.73]|eukprot:ORX89205.1 hypothetical protein K493DRAFT_267364 [Basidiobolus meristosporus CBS 931.73]
MNTQSHFPAKPRQFSRPELINILIDETVLFIQYIWPSEASEQQAVPLRIYIQEVLRRSRTSFSTLLIALIYLFRLKSALAKECNQSLLEGCRGHYGCGRRMFLAAIIVATKFLQDRGTTNLGWARLSGLSVKEINENERGFLKLLNYNIFVSSPLFSWWSTLLINKVDNSLEVKESLPRVETPVQPPVALTNHKKRSNPGSFTSYPSIRPKYHHSFTCNPYPLSSQHNIELSPPFVESSSEDEE